MNYEKQRKHALKIFKDKKYKELKKAIKAEYCFVELLKIAKKCNAIEKVDCFLSEWAYEWVKMFPEDRNIMKGRVVESKWAYWWVRDFPEDYNYFYSVM